MASTSICPTWGWSRASTFASSTGCSTTSAPELTATDATPNPPAVAASRQGRIEGKIAGKLPSPIFLQIGSNYRNRQLDCGGKSAQFVRALRYFRQLTLGYPVVNSSDRDPAFGSRPNRNPHNALRRRKAARRMLL